MRRVLAGFAATAILSGCRTPCAPVPPTPAAGLLQEASAEQRAALAVPVPAAAPAPEILTLPQFVELALVNNLRIQAGRENIELARGDFVSDSLIPNCQLFVDAQLIPITPVNPDNQAGPPQYDAAATIPIDWFLFGKRVAARAAARLEIDVASHRQADLVRRTVADAVQACYDLLEAHQLQKLADEDLKELEETEKLVDGTLKKDGKKDEKNDDNAKLDAERIRLATADARREQHRRQAATAALKAKLRPFLGRTWADRDFELSGSLAVSKALPPVSLPEALRLAEACRPDAAAGRAAVAQADAALERERRKGKPQVSVVAGYDYQDQVRITGFRNSSFATLGLNTTLPTTDRNQGNIFKAAAAARAGRLTLAADRADLHAEVEAAVAAYREAFEAVTGDDPASLASSRRVRDGSQAAYQKGEKTLLEVLDAERAFRDRLKNIVSSRTDYWQALHRLNAAVGLRALSTDQPAAEKDDLAELSGSDAGKAGDANAGAAKKDDKAEAKKDAKPDAAKEAPAKPKP